MKPNLIKVYTDEDVDIAVAKALRLRGFEATTTLEHGKLANPDEKQLIYATSIGMSILTHNIHDFPRIHYQFINQGIFHRGIIIAKQVSVGEIVKRFLRLATALSAEDMENRLEYLSNW